MIKLGMYDQDRWQREGENKDRLQKMKEKAIKDGDVSVFNAINQYEKFNDVTVLINIIKNLYNANKDNLVCGYIIEYSYDYGVYGSTVGCHTLNQAREMGEAMYKWANENREHVDYIWVRQDGEVCFVVYQDTIPTKKES